MSVELHPGQSSIFEDLFLKRSHRYHAVNCSRGWGKSVLNATGATMACLELQELPATVPNKSAYIIAPTFDQVTEIYLPLLTYQFGLADWGIDPKRQTGVAEFPNNTFLHLLSYESVERMRGKGAYYVGWDEVSSCTKAISPKEAWESIIRPCIVTRWSPMHARQYGAPSPGRAMFISTPKGYNYFYDLCMMSELDPEFAYSHFDYTRAPYLDQSEITKIRENTDPIKFASEYLALFRESGANVFYMFDRKIHVSPLPDWQEGEVVHAAIDFNVGKQHTSFAAIRGGQVHWLDEMSGHPDTAQLARAIKARFPGRKIVAFPDPSGKARKTSAAVGVTDFSILQAAGIETLSRPAAPPISDSVNAVNRMLMNANERINMFFAPKCRQLIASMERTIWLENRPDSAMIDKRGGWEHPSDGVRYLTEYLFPVSGSSRVTKSGHF